MSLYLKENKGDSRRYIFIDESGDLGKQGSRYFIISAIATNDPKEVRRIIKRFRERKLKKKLKDVNEIKANTSTPEIRNYMLSKLSECDCDIFAVVVDKGKILTKYDKAQDRLYHLLCRLLLHRVTIQDGDTTIIIDQKDTNKLIKTNFKNYIEMNFDRKRKRVKFQQIQSFNDNGLLIVDFVAWAVNRKYNFQEESYFNIIKSKIKNLENIELWK